MTSAPLINILVRTHLRDIEFALCMNSIAKQTYKNVKVIVCTDSANESYADTTYQHYLEVIMDNRRLNYELFYVHPTGVPYHWNFYCNNLKERVTDGWFFYCDDDDALHRPTALEEIAQHLTDPSEGVICQFNRGSRAKPEYSGLTLVHGGYIQTESIVRGKIGGSCIFLHHSQKDIANWDGQRAADYRFIKAVAEKIPLKFVPVVVVQAGNNGRHGK